ncbi:MAG: glutamyl-tRNA reductase [Bacillota bacterium]
MHIILVGLNHRTAPVEVRERLSFAGQSLLDALEHLRRLPELEEAAVLSTCNRTEIYAVAPQFHPGTDALKGFLESRGRELGLSGVSEHLYVHHGQEAVSHLFTVVTGLDSMILGETQILGQTKEAYLTSADQGTVGKTLHALFSHALAVGKRAHTETGISQSAVSVPYAAVELARKVFSNLGGRKVLILGAGEMADLTARHLVQAGAAQIAVANRTYEKGLAMAQQYGGVGVRWDQLESWLEQADVVISSTGAPDLVLTRDRLARAMSPRRGRPIFLFDIAVPRDIDPECGRLENVFLYDIDDLEAAVAANLRERRREARRVERIIEEEVASFAAWLKTQDVVPLIRSLRGKAEAVRKAELERALARLPELGERERSIIEAMTVTLVNKLLNDPTLRIKEFASASQGEVYLEAVTQLFNLDDSPNRETDAEKADALSPALGGLAAQGGAVHGRR